VSTKTNPIKELDLGLLPNNWGEGGANPSELRKLLEAAGAKIEPLRLATIAAGTDVTATPAMVAHGKMRFLGMWLLNAAAITAEDTNYTTITITEAGADGLGTNQILQFSTKLAASGGIGDVVSLVPKWIPANKANLIVENGRAIMYTKTHGGAGMALTTPIFEFVFAPIVQRGLHNRLRPSR
jgi:hypothetical protein